MSAGSDPSDVTFLESTTANNASASGRSIYTVSEVFPTTVLTERSSGSLLVSGPFDHTVHLPQDQRPAPYSSSDVGPVPYSGSAGAIGSSTNKTVPGTGLSAVSERATLEHLSLDVNLRPSSGRELRDLSAQSQTGNPCQSVLAQDPIPADPFKTVPLTGRFAVSQRNPLEHPSLDVNLRPSSERVPREADDVRFAHLSANNAPASGRSMKTVSEVFPKTVLTERSGGSLLVSGPFDHTVHLPQNQRSAPCSASDVGPVPYSGSTGATGSSTNKTVPGTGLSAVSERAPLEHSSLETNPRPSSGREPRDLSAQSHTRNPYQSVLTQNPIPTDPLIPPTAPPMHAQPVSCFSKIALETEQLRGELLSSQENDLSKRLIMCVQTCGLALEMGLNQETSLET